MQNDTLATNESAATEKSLDSTSTQQTSAAQPGSAATANSVLPDTTSPQKSSASQPRIDEDLIEIIDELAAELKRYAGYALGWKISMGVTLRDYRDDLESDDWNLVLESGRLPFSGRTAQTLARIGDHKIFTDVNRLHQLPHSMMVLNEIAALPLAVAEEALANGTIHPGTTLAKAKKLVAEHRAKKSEMLRLLSKITPI